MIIEIKNCKAKFFPDDENPEQLVPWYWSKVKREDGVVVKMGGKTDYSARVGEKVQILDLEKTEKGWYREVLE